MRPWKSFTPIQEAIEIDTKLMGKRETVMIFLNTGQSLVDMDGFFLEMTIQGPGRLASASSSSTVLSSSLSKCCRYVLNIATFPAFLTNVSSEVAHPEN
jgi:hypothetical protein